MAYLNRKIYYLLIILFLFVLIHSIVYSWPVENGVVVSIKSCAICPEETNAQIINDDAGGVIITFTHGNPYYAQRLSDLGLRQWAINGVSLGPYFSSKTYSNYLKQLISDGAGGAIQTWQSSGSIVDVIVQKINDNGVIQWSSSGVSICTVAYEFTQPSIATDSAGGAIITWADNRDSTSNGKDIYAQKVNSTGIPQWTSNGIPICIVSTNQIYPDIAEDGSGGAYIVWNDVRDGLNQVYAQHVNSNGSTFWASNGIHIVTNSFSIESNAKIVSDKAGGLVIGYLGTNGVQGQRIDSSGTFLWGSNGTVLHPSTNIFSEPFVCTDSTGDAIFTWTTLSIIYAQKVLSSGTVLWQSNGVPVSSAAGFFPKAISDGSGGAIIAWEDDRSGVTTDIYTQRVNSQGSTLWTINGVAVCTADNYQYFPYLVSDGTGGAFITWQDRRSLNPGIYAQHINSIGTMENPVSVPRNYWEFIRE